MQLFGLLTVRKRPLLVGVTAAWYFAVCLLAFAPALIASPASAQKPVTCFLRAECIDSKTVGNCDTEHCFEARPKDCPNAQGACYANPPAVPLIIAIGGKTRALDISDYIAIIFNYGVGIAALIATVMFMIGGFQYLSAGTSDRVNQGKERIKNAIIGMILAFGAIILLRTVNPDILKLQMPKIEITKRKLLASGAYTETCAPCGVPYIVLTEKGTGKTATSSGDCGFVREGTTLSEADAAKFDSSAQCIGKGCGGDKVPASGSETTCSDFQYRCSRAVAGEKFECGHPPPAPKDAPPSAPNTSGGYACKSCKPDGASCVRTGANDECCGGYCADTATGNKCASGDPGDACDDDSECRTGKCQRNWGNSCSNGEIGSPCDDSKECKTGFQCNSGSYANFVRTCSPGVQYSLCGDDKQCNSGFHCVNLASYVDVCMPMNVSNDSFKSIVCNPKLNGTVSDDCCNTNADCAGRGGYCQTDDSNFCTDGAPGAPCEHGKGWECASGFCSNNVCTTGAPGSSCIDDSSCQSKHCYKGGDFDVCVSGGRGSRCDDASDCNGTGQGVTCSQNRCGFGQSAADRQATPAPVMKDGTAVPMFTGH